MSSGPYYINVLIVPLCVMRITVCCPSVYEMLSSSLCLCLSVTLLIIICFNTVEHIILFHCLVVCPSHNSALNDEVLRYRKKLDSPHSRLRRPLYQL